MRSKRPGVIACAQFRNSVIKQDDIMSCCVLLADEKLHQGPERSTTRESGMFVKCAQVNEIVLIAIVATGIAILIAID